MDKQDEEKKIIALIKFMLPTLPNSETKVAEFILENILEVSEMTLAEFSASTNTGQATIVRLCKRLGLTGYAELKRLLKNHTEETPTAILEMQNGNLGEDINQIIQNVFKVNIQILTETFALLNDEYEKAFQAIITAKDISFFAIGDALIPCEYAKFKFRRLGYNCFVDKDCDMQMINATYLKKGDVAIAISHSGNSKQVVDAMRIAHENGATTICITKRERSELIKYSDIKLFTATPDITVGQEIVARRISEQAILEALYFGVLLNNEEGNLEKINKTSEALKNNKL